MAVEYKENSIIFSGSVFENDLVEINEYLKGHKEALIFDLTACKDLHGAIIQLLLAFKAIYGSSFVFSEKETVYQKALEGFRTIEDDCNK